MAEVTITLADIEDNAVDVGVQFINNDGTEATDNSSIAHRLGAYLLSCANQVHNEGDEE